MNKNKLNKHKLITSITGVVATISVGSIVSTPFINNKINNISNHDSYSKLENNTNKNDVILNDSNNPLMDTNSSKTKPLVPSVSNFENAKLSTKQGPIVFWGDTIRSLDWFGAERWSVDLPSLNVMNKDGQNAFPKTYGTDVKRSWMNWELDRKNNKIWILSNIANGSWNENDQEFKHQYLISLSTEDGTLIDQYRLNRNNGRNDVYRNVSIFSDGTPFVYGLGFSLHRTWGNNTAGYTFLGEKLDINTKKMVNISNDEIAKKFPKVHQETKDGMDYFFNIIPIANNRNLFFTVQRSNIRSSNQFGSDKPFEKTPNDVSKMNMSITAILLDDNLKEVSGINQWSGGNLVKIIESANDKFKNKYTFPQRDWYTLLDGRVVTIIYDTLLIFDPSDPNNPGIQKYKIGNDGDWVESWTFDTNEDLFYKLYGSSEIRKLTLDKSKGNAHTKSLYYDLKNSSEEIKKHASSFSIYNVSGYSGQIMIINSYFDGYNSSNPLPNVDDSNQYGLAAAIVNHATDKNTGDTKGLLNTDKAFQKSADFDIKENVLNNKLPSEITREDLDLLNNSFFTKRTDLNDDKTLKYEPFVKNEIDDIQKKLKITVNIDQIPWFVSDNKMPNDIKPLKITKEFNSAVNISDRFIWKNASVDDYDFKNTLPSKLELKDVERISPLISTISSQKTTINGIEYPKTIYTIKEKDDTKGTVKIEAEYKYLPMDTKAIENNVKSYKLEKVYNIFKSSTQKTFNFVGINQNNSSEDISSIPSLKELKEANLFPSYFQNASKQEFLKFINANDTNGYPLEKMNISVQYNDNLGSLTISVDSSSYYPNDTIKTKTYTGLNKKSSYSFSFKDQVDSSFRKKDYRPSEISDELFFKHFVNYSGFDSSDLNVSFIPNNQNGSLLVNVTLNSNYPADVLENTGFKKENGVYQQIKNIIGFKTNDEFNSEYQLIYKDDNDKSLLEFKKLTPATIKAKLLTSEGLTVNSKLYKNNFDLAKEFVKSRGSKIPEIDKDSNKVSVELFDNNSGGEITFKITYNNLDGYPNPLTFIQKFTGFAKGNDVVTPDVLTFKDSNQLKITNSELLKMKPKEIEGMIKDKSLSIETFLSGSPTGSYKTAIDNNKFTLEINADDNYGTLTINIKFNRSDITNTSSLLEYSQTFSGFNHF